MHKVTGGCWRWSVSLDRAWRGWRCKWSHRRNPASGAPKYPSLASAPPPSKFLAVISFPASVLRLTVPRAVFSSLVQSACHLQRCLEQICWLCYGAFRTFSAYIMKKNSLHALHHPLKCRIGFFQVTFSLSARCFLQWENDIFFCSVSGGHIFLVPSSCASDHCQSYWAVVDAPPGRHLLTLWLSFQWCCICFFFFFYTQKVYLCLNDESEQEIGTKETSILFCVVCIFCLLASCFLWNIYFLSCSCYFVLEALYEIKQGKDRQAGIASFRYQARDTAAIVRACDTSGLPWNQGVTIGCKMIPF